MNQVLALWTQRLAVAHQAVYYPDGTARALALDPTSHSAHLGAPLDVSALLEATQHAATSVDTVLARMTLPISARELVCGESDHGSEGYIALLDADQSLRWLAFFADSNPFVAIDVHDDVATIHSSNGKSISVRIDTADFVPLTWDVDGRPPG